MNLLSKHRAYVKLLDAINVSVVGSYILYSFLELSKFMTISIIFSKNKKNINTLYKYQYSSKFLLLI